MKLLQGDCLELMKDIPDGSIDMVLCDLPYGTTQNKWDTTIPLDSLWEQYKRVCKKNAAILLFGQMPFSAALVMSNLKDFRYQIIWEKTKAGGFLDARRKPMRAHEDINVFYRALPTYNPQMQAGGAYRVTHVSNGDGRCYGKFERMNTVNVNTGTRFPRDVIKFANGNYKSPHPTQKPVPLLEYLVKTYTNPGELVLDNCMGSGSTGVACVNTGRDFIGMELDEHYFTIAKERIEKSAFYETSDGSDSSVK